MNGYFRRNGLFAAIDIAGRLPLLFTLGLPASVIGPEKYGAWSLVLAAVMVISSVSALGLGSSLTRTVGGATPEQANGYLAFALRITTSLAIAAGVVVALGHGPLGAALGVPGDDRLLLVLAGPLAAATTTEALLDAYFKAREDVVHEAILVASRTAVEVAVVVVVFASSWISEDSDTRLFAYVAGTVGIKVAFLYPALVFVGVGRRERPERRARRIFLRYGAPLIPSALLIWLTTQGDRLVLGHTVDQYDLGLYGFAAVLALNLSYLTLAIYPLLLPRASVLYDEGEHEEVDRLFRASQRVYLALFSGAAVAIGLLSSDIIRLIAGEAFVPSAGVFLLLSLTVGLDGLVGIYQWVFQLVRRTSLILVFNLVYVALQLGAVYVVATATGSIEAVAWAVLGVVVAANFVRYVVARSVYIIRMPKTILVQVAALAVVTAGASEIAPEIPLSMRITAGIAAGLGGVVMALRAVRTSGLTA